MGPISPIGPAVQHGLHTGRSKPCKICTNQQPRPKTHPLHIASHNFLIIVPQSLTERTSFSGMELALFPLMNDLLTTLLNLQALDFSDAPAPDAESQRTELRSRIP